MEHKPTNFIFQCKCKKRNNEHEWQMTPREHLFVLFFGILFFLTLSIRFLMFIMFWWQYPRSCQRNGSVLFAFGYFPKVNSWISFLALCVLSLKAVKWKTFIADWERKTLSFEKEIKMESVRRPSKWKTFFLRLFLFFLFYFFFFNIVQFKKWKKTKEIGVLRILNILHELQYWHYSIRTRFWKNLVSHQLQFRLSFFDKWSKPLNKAAK